MESRGKLEKSQEKVGEFHVKNFEDTLDEQVFENAQFQMSRQKVG